MICERALLYCRSFTLTVIVTLPKETKKYVYAVKQLPEAITPEPNKTYTKVIKGSSLDSVS